MYCVNGKPRSSLFIVYRLYDTYERQRNNFFYYCRYSGCPARVCVCVCVCALPVRSFLPPRVCRPGRTCSPLHGKLLYNYSGATKYGYQRNPRNVIMTLLFSVLTENDSFRSCIQHIRLPPSCAFPQYKYV